MRRRSMMLGLAGFSAMAAAPASGPVVLELFTSQSCSSCPPADALLGELARRAGVIALAWHVTYWNGLGWQDPFATQIATDRQRAYAAALHDEVYTPALVVNGSSIVVGSDRRAVAQAMAAAPPLTVAVELRRRSDGVAASIGPIAEPARIVYALYDAERETPVGSGENSGRRLRDYCIVRQAAFSTAAAGALMFPPPKPGQGAAVLVQGAELRVLGAAHIPPA